ncbi:alpha/beta hydrolase [Scytonema millei VB511283]|uniref:Alpha/beta hydrolase n=1 Tax=Scytonema millei VB511283 TaxID=1245923 RepID=A0A9X5E3L8_9CYAN|nr:alpha/beta hydrolase [Scytonema millei VB511283]
MKCPNLSALYYGFAVWVSAVIVFSSTSVFAAERVVLKYRAFRESIAVEDLTKFARTGEMSPDLRVNLALARQDPQTIRQSLTNTVTVDPILLDRVLNNAVGELLLDEIGKTIHPSSRQANRQALRAAMTLSARDRQLSLLEILQNYPTTDVEVEGDRLEAVYSQLRRLEGTLKNFLMKNFLK